MIFSLLSFGQIFEEEYKAKNEYEDDLKALGAAEANRIKEEKCAQRRLANRKKSFKDAKLMAFIFSPIPLIFFLLSAIGGGTLGGLIIAVSIEAIVWLTALAVFRIKSHNPYK